MTTVLIKRSTDSAYLCSQRGPTLLNDAERDRAVITVHASEMSPDLAAALTREATRVSSTHHVRRPKARETPSYQVTTIRCSRNDIPYGRPGHIEQISCKLVLLYDESEVAPELAARLTALVQEVGRYYDLKAPEELKA
jgi:hypothetical protein